jgi:hypothetical protein
VAGLVVSASARARRDPHPAHQTQHALAVHVDAFGAQHRRHSARTEKRPGSEQVVYPPHQRRVVVVGLLARPVDTRARHAQKRALPPNRQRFVGAVEHRSAVRRAHLPDLRAKKSRSTVSCPILACSRSISHSCEGARRLILKLLLPGVNLVRVDLVALRKVRDRPLLPQRLRGDLRLQPAVNPPSRLLRHRSLRLSNEAAGFQ